MTRRRVSPVRITRADGTTETRPPYAPKVLRAIVTTPNAGPPPPWLTARHDGTCPVCTEPIHIGDRIDIRGWEQRRAVHHRCAPDWRPG